MAKFSKAVIGLLRSLRAETPKVGIAISVVAPGLTVTPMLASPDGTLSPEQNAVKLVKNGFAVNRVESVALTVGYLLNRGRKSNGMGILVQNDMMVDLEQGYVNSRETLMGTEMLEILQSGSKVELYPRIKDPAKL